MGSRVPLTFLFLCVFMGSRIWAQTDCGWNPDYDGDDVIGVSDLLGFLGVFEDVDSDGDGIFDSLDECIGAYDDCGVCNGSGVDADADGVCDDVDDCVGSVDACGVCNGPGPTIPVMEEIIYVTDSVYLEPLEEWYVFDYAVDTVFSFVCPIAGCTDEAAGNFNPEANAEDGSCAYGPAQCGGLSTLTYQGYEYDLVAIGERCWFAENLQAEFYANGDAITIIDDPGMWSEQLGGAYMGYWDGTVWCFMPPCYNYDLVDAYGWLYNWHAVNDERGLCPAGWHVPTDAEWTALEVGVGGDAGALKAVEWNGSNASGFSALPGGFRTESGAFEDVGVHGVFWTSSAYQSDHAWYRLLGTDYDFVYRNDYDRRAGFSVRCLLD